MKQEKNRQMDNLKSEYESIPVPKEAKERMLAGIAQAKKEQKGVIIMKFAKKTGGAAAAAMIAITVLANATPALANAMEQIPVIGSIAKVVTFRTYEDKKNHFEADIKVPQVTIEGTEGAQVPANKSIEDYGNELIAMYEEELSKDNGEGHYGLDSRYEVVTDNSKYLCIRIDTTLTMASGTQFVKVFTIDKATGNVISLRTCSMTVRKCWIPSAPTLRARWRNRWQRMSPSCTSTNPICRMRISRDLQAMRAIISMKTANL